jgi:hypothetical protein
MELEVIPIMAISIVLIPVIGFTARYVLKPFEDTLARFLQARSTDDAVRMLERRMALIEQQLDAMETSIARLADAAEFQRELHATPPRAAGQIAVAPTGRPPVPPHDVRP